MSSPARVIVLAAVLALAACGDGESAVAPSTTIATTVAPPSTGPTSTGPAPTSAPTTSPPTSSTAPAPPSATAAELCDLGTAVREPATVESGLLTEVSGIAHSRRHEVIWAHNDSGGNARLHAIHADTGADLGAWGLDGAAAFDWEDMALAVDPTGEHHLYAADFGDNFRIRADIRVYRATEPADLTEPGPLATEEFVFLYPDGATDAEAFLIDPVTGDFVVISKPWDGSATTIYRAPGDTAPETPTTLERVGEIDLSGFSPFATAADITADGGIVGVRTYAEVLMWDRAADQPLAAALADAPCVAPSAPEVQGEALTFLPDGSGYVTISEGEGPAVNRFAIDR